MPGHIGKNQRTASPWRLAAYLIKTPSIYPWDFHVLKEMNNEYLCKTHQDDSLNQGHATPKIKNWPYGMPVIQNGPTSIAIPVIIFY